MKAMVIPMTTTRRSTLRLTLAGVALSLARGVRAETPTALAVWKDPNCGCCDGWVRHMRDAGFRVTTSDSNNMEAVKRARGVPDELQSCHTAVIDGYVIEGHVPAEDIKRLIAERPGARGVAVAGMPRSAPGMDQPGEPYTVVLFGTPTGDKIYATH